MSAYDLVKPNFNTQETSVPNAWYASHMRFPKNTNHKPFGESDTKATGRHRGQRNHIACCLWVWVSLTRAARATYLPPETKFIRMSILRKSY